MLRTEKVIAKYFFNIFSNPKLIETGKIIDGVRDSVWVGYRKDGTKYYEELYAQGELQMVFHLTEPVFNILMIRLPRWLLHKGEMQGLGDHLMRTLMYPKMARRKGIQGKVFVEFEVDKVGEITNIIVIKGIGYECDEEAVRA